MTYKNETECRRSDETQILFTLDLAGNFKFVDAAAERLFGFVSDEMCCMNVAQLVAPNYADYLREQIARAVVGDLGAVYEIEIYTKAGACVPLEISLRPVVRNGCPFELEAIAFPRLTSWPQRPKCLDEEFWISPGLNSPRALILI